MPNSMKENHMEQAEIERLELEKEVSQFLAQSFLELDEGERQLMKRFGLTQIASSVDVLPHQVQERTAQEIEKPPFQVQDVLFQLVPYGSLSYCWAFNCITDTSIPRNYRYVNGFEKPCVVG